MFLVEFPIEETMIFNSPREIEIGEKESVFESSSPYKKCTYRKNIRNLQNCANEQNGYGKNILVLV